MLWPNHVVFESPFHLTPVRSITLPVFIAKHSKWFRWHHLYLLTLPPIYLLYLALISLLRVSRKHPVFLATVSEYRPILGVIGTRFFH